MSQSTYKLKDGRYVVWGKDHAMGVFLDLHKNGDIDVDSVISEESAMFTGLTPSQMVEKLMELGVPEEEI